MRLLIDFLPIVVFVLVYYYAPEALSLIEPMVSQEILDYLTQLPKLALATAVLIPLTALQVIVTYLLWKKVENMHVISFVLVFVLGGLTVISQDKTFIQWKPTLLNWLFAILFLGSHFIGSKPLIERFMSKNIVLPQLVWRKLSYAWIGFFIIAGTTNLIIAFNFSEAFWVNFKLFGMLGLTLVFVIIQGVLLAPYIQETQQNSDSSD
jgi:intracellular septation protein